MRNLSFFLAAFTFFILSQNLYFSQSGQNLKSYNSSEGFVVHEWGTFTSLRASDGRVLSGLEKEEEKLPEFVNNICFCYEKARDWTNKGFTTENSVIKNVTIKMETPVIYFYTSENVFKKVTVNVGFKNGSISQWYPYRSRGEIIPRKQITYPIFDQTSVIDFSVPRKGFIEWEATILPKSEIVPFSSDPKLETYEWLAPRLTASNLIKTKNPAFYWDTAYQNSPKSDQVEKFLFYRGIGNFNEPINITFNTSRNLVVTNKGMDRLNYVLVYERKRNKSIKIWWSGTISGQTTKVIVDPNDSSIDPKNEMERFVSKLVSAGLYEDEARAMLETWEKSYFENEGLKVFWIVPSSFTEEILPIYIYPPTDKIKRVLIGRSEILTPEFEKELIYDLETNYSEDRFVLAYRELLQKGISNKWTDYNQLSEDELDPDEQISGIITTADYSNLKHAEFYPNPVTGNVTIKIYDDKDESICLKIFDEKGDLIKSYEEIKKGENSISMHNLPGGIYNIKIEYQDGKTVARKIIKE